MEMVIESNVNAVQINSNSDLLRSEKEFGLSSSRSHGNKHFEFPSSEKPDQSNIEEIQEVRETGDDFGKDICHLFKEEAGLICGKDGEASIHPLNKEEIPQRINVPFETLGTKSAFCLFSFYIQEVGFYFLLCLIFFWHFTVISR